MLPSIQSEPLRRLAVIAAPIVIGAQLLIGPLLGVFLAMGLVIPPDLLGAIDVLLRAIVSVLAVWGVTVAGREQVYAQDTTQAIANRAAATGNVNIGEPPTGPFDPDAPLPTGELFP